MIKRNKRKLVMTSVVTLLPILAGLFLWDRLPEELATHWGADGKADGWSSKSFAVFALPLFLLALHWICVAFTAADPKNKGQSKKAVGLVLWICPAVSVLVGAVIYASALGAEFNMMSAALLVMAVMFIVLGNYLPKCKQNYTIGIKLPWTLNSEENWNRTHRLAGKVWVAGGLVLILCCLLPKSVIQWVLIIVILALVAMPVIYSYAYYRKQLREEMDTPPDGGTEDKRD